MGRGRLPPGIERLRNEMGKEFDWEGSTAGFDKEKAMKEAEEQSLKLREEYEEIPSLENSDVVDSLALSPLFETIKEPLSQILHSGVTPETAYDPNKWIYDSISCEAFERLTNQDMDKQARRRQQEDQRKLDEETFGIQNGPPLNPVNASGRFNPPSLMPRPGGPTGGPRPTGGPSGPRPTGPHPGGPRTNPNARPMSAGPGVYNAGNRQYNSYNHPQNSGNYPNRTLSYPSNNFNPRNGKQPQKTLKPQQNQTGRRPSAPAGNKKSAW